jgi:phosphoribosylformimino-5-aminoimidazole carboxamide ribotide isomerase
MDIVPVIDLCDGEAVRAVEGRRADYRPLVTPLARTSAPCDVVAGLLRLHPFRAVYVADLDAIEGKGASLGTNRATIEKLATTFPRQRFFVDAGARDPASLRDWLTLPQIEAVLGSESLASVEPLRELGRDPRILLSLDFRGDRFLGPPELLDRPELWPQRVVVMTLARVGAPFGPDVERLLAVKSRAENRPLYAAGGVRDVRDLDALRAAGATGALVASALHDGRLTPDDLDRLQGRTA